MEVDHSEPATTEAVDALVDLQLIPRNHRLVAARKATIICIYCMEELLGKGGTHGNNYRQESAEATWHQGQCKEADTECESQELCRAEEGGSLMDVLTAFVEHLERDAGRAQAAQKKMEELRNASRIRIDHVRRRDALAPHGNEG